MFRTCQIGLPQSLTSSNLLLDCSPPPPCYGSSDMDPKNLSSNWKKLQETLKKKDVSAASTKRKASDRESQNATVKKRRTERPVEKKISDRPRAPAKRKRMSDVPVHGPENGAPDSTPVTRNAQPNEGRSPT